MIGTVLTTWNPWLSRNKRAWFAGWPMTLGSETVLALVSPRHTKKPATRSAMTTATAIQTDWAVESRLVATSWTGPPMTTTGGSGIGVAPVDPVSSGTTAGTTTVESLGGSTAVVFAAPRTEVAPTPTASVTFSASTG